MSAYTMNCCLRVPDKNTFVLLLCKCSLIAVNAGRQSWFLSCADCYRQPGYCLWMSEVSVLHDLLVSLRRPVKELYSDWTYCPSSFLYQFLAIVSFFDACDLLSWHPMGLIMM